MDKLACLRIKLVLMMLPAYFLADELKKIMESIQALSTSVSFSLVWTKYDVSPCASFLTLFNCTEKRARKTKKKYMRTTANQFSQMRVIAQAAGIILSFKLQRASQRQFDTHKEVEKRREK